MLLYFPLLSSSLLEEYMLPCRVNPLYVSKNIPCSTIIITATDNYFSLISKQLIIDDALF